MPCKRNDGRQTGIGQIDAVVRFDLCARAIVTGFPARFLGGIRVVRDNGSGIDCQCVTGMRVMSVRRVAGSGMGVFARRLKQTGIRHSRSQSKRPHQHRHERGVSSGAGV